MPPTRMLFLLFLLLSGTTAAAEWEPVTTQLIQAEKPGYGKLSGVVVDHQTGDVYVNLSDRGLFRSTDQGKSWKRLGSQPLKGRTEWPGCLMLDPTGKTKRLVVAVVYGAPISTTSDNGDNWKTFHAKSGHVDWCAVDWTDPDLGFVLALKHELGGLLLVSRDGGKSFAEVGKGYGPAWVFDGNTAVVAEMKTKDKPKPGLMRTTDAGKTFKPCGDYSTQALPKWRAGVLYWLVDGALIASTDRGESWKKLGDIKEGRYGPIFGKDAKHLFVLTKQGIVESTDAGATWSQPLALPKEVQGGSPLTWLDYDPKNDVLYVMKMTSELYRMPRGR